MVERRSPKPIVVGSNPTGPAIYEQKLIMTEIQPNSIGHIESPASFRLTDYIKSVRAELGNVSWPDRAHIVRASAIVIALCVGMSVVVGVVDYILTVVLIGLNRVL